MAMANQLLVTHPAFPPSCNPKPIPVPKSQDLILRNTFYLGTPVPTTIRTPQDFPHTGNTLLRTNISEAQVKSLELKNSFYGYDQGT